MGSGNIASGNIPRVFWYTVSLCILAATAILLYIALKSTSISVEIANTKINLSGVVAETERLNEDLQRQNEELMTAKSELEKRYEKLVASMGPESTTEPSQVEQLDPRNLQLESATISQDRFVRNKDKLEKLKAKLE